MRASDNNNVSGPKDGIGADCRRHKTVKHLKMNQKAKKIIKYSISLALAVVLTYFCFRGVEWEDFWRGLADCRWGWVLASMVIGLASNWFRSERWRLLLLPIDRETTRVTVFNAVNIGYIANFVFPRIGEFVRCGVISKNSEKSTYDKVIGTVVTERAFDVVVLLVLLFAFLLLKWEQFGAFFQEKIWVPLAQSLDFSVWWIVALCIACFAAFVYVVMKYSHKSRLLAKVGSVFSGLWTGLVSCFRMEHQWKFHLHTILLWLSYFLMSYTVMKAVPSVDFMNGTDAMFLMLVGSLGWVVPVPGGFGAFHYIVALAISTVYGLPFEMGIVFATLSHESQSIMMVLSGLYSYIYEAVKK